MRAQVIAAAGLLAAASVLAACQPRNTAGAAPPMPPPAAENVVDHGGEVPPPRGTPAVQEGYRIAMYTCSECHVVAANQKVPPRQIPNGPTFLSIANRPDLTPQRLREHLMFTHRTAATPDHMPNPELFDYQIDDVIAYLRSLRRS